jgi:hypothetical protein
MWCGARAARIDGIQPAKTKEHVMSVHLLLAESTVDSTTITGDRLVATVAALLALAGAVTGGLALARRTGGLQPVIALVAGVVGVVTGGLVIATADGGPGTGNGIVGVYF